MRGWWGHSHVNSSHLGRQLLTWHVGICPWCWSDAPHARLQACCTHTNSGNRPNFYMNMVIMQSNICNKPTGARNTSSNGAKISTTAVVYIISSLSYMFHTIGISDFPSAVVLGHSNCVWLEMRLRHQLGSRDRWLAQMYSEESIEHNRKWGFFVALQNKGSGKRRPDELVCYTGLFCESVFHIAFVCKSVMSGVREHVSLFPHFKKYL